MNLERACLESLASHVRAEVADCGVLAGACLPVPDLAMAFHVEEAASERIGESHSVSVVFDARALGSAEPGIRMLALGLGSTLEAAASDAGHQWAVGVFPVLLSYLLDGAHADVQRSPMIVGVQETGERFGWTVHLGPVIARLYGPRDTPEIDRGDLSASAAYRPIFDVLHPFAAHTHLTWIESFAARYPHGKVDATCRLRNDEWPEGRESLLAWAASWTDTGPFVLSKRQFLLLQPTALEGLKSTTDLSAALDREMARMKPPLAGT